MRKMYLILCLGYVLLLGNYQQTYAMSSKKMKVVEEISDSVIEEVVVEEEQVEKPVVEKPKILEPLKQIEVVLSNENIVGLYNEIREDKKMIRRYPLGYSANTYEGYTNEVVAIEVGETKNYKVLEKPTFSKYRVKIEGSVLYFETTNQGKYILELEGSLGIKRKISIDAKLKYSFTEQENYDIIWNSYLDMNLARYRSAREIFKMAFPNSLKIKEISMLELEMLEGLETSEKLSIIRNLKDEFQMTSSEEKDLAYMELDTLGNKEDFIYKNLNISGFEERLVEILLIKKQPSRRDVEFLEERYKDTYNLEIAKKIANYYESNNENARSLRYYRYVGDEKAIVRIYSKEGNIEALEELATEKEDSASILREIELIKSKNTLKREIDLGDTRYNDENYQEAILFYNRALKRNKALASELGIDLKIGMSYYNLFNYELAAGYLIRALEANNKDVEIYYYLAMSYYRNENFEKSLEYFNKVVEDYPSTSWAKKSKIYIIRLNKNVALEKSGEEKIETPTKISN